MISKILSKKYILLIILGCFVLFPSLFGNKIQAQDDDNVLKTGLFELEMQQVLWNGNKVKFDTLQSKQLKKGENFIIAYKNDKLGCMVQLIYKRSGSKINLSLRPIVEMADGKWHYGNMSKSHHEIKDSKSPMKGKVNETVTYDRQTMSTVQVEFNYVLY